METVVIVGSGLVGRSWAMLFASGGHQVRLFDVIPEALQTATSLIKEQLKTLEKDGQLKNSENLNAEKQFSLIKSYLSLEEALTGATYVQECTPESLELKTATFKELNRVLLAIGNQDAIIGSSSSTIGGSLFTAGLEIQKRSLIVHPVNPPYFVRLVELVPTPQTKPEVTTKVRNLLNSLGHKPIVINKEVPGFALNRVQYAILNETWRLVSEGVMNVEDVDTVMKEGLAPRYVFMGPLETAQLNANGFIDYCQRYGTSIFDVSETQLRIPKMTPEAAKDIDKQLQALVPDTQLTERRIWRDNNLARLASFKNDLGL